MKLKVLLSVICFVLMLRMIDYSSQILRDCYVAELKSYENSPYEWGGESYFGIDCSGLVRRAYLNALQKQAKHFFRVDLYLKYYMLLNHDFRARQIRTQPRDFVFIERIANLNQADLSKLQPGDLGVLENGKHVIAYLGDNQWIEANGTMHKVIRVQLPENKLLYYSKPIYIYRWRSLT